MSRTIKSKENSHRGQLKGIRHRKAGKYKKKVYDSWDRENIDKRFRDRKALRKYPKQAIKREEES